MKKITFTILIFGFTTISVIAQKEATTSDGKKIILNYDGTWKYAETTQVEKGISLECSDVIATETDRVTGRTSTGAINTLVISEDGDKTGFGIYLMNVATSLVIRIQVIGSGNCIDKDGTMNILFKDGTRLTLSNGTGFNCEGNFTLYFGGLFRKENQLEMLRTKEVETMRIWTSRSYVEKDFTVNQSKQLMKTIDCLVNELNK